MGARKQDYGHSFEDYFKRAVNPMLILSLLQERPKYAYEMTQELKERTGGEYNMPLLYPVLYRLQDQGFIEESEKVISQNNRVRNYYRLTPARYRPPGGHAAGLCPPLPSCPASDRSAGGDRP